MDLDIRCLEEFTISLDVAKGSDDLVGLDERLDYWIPDAWMIDQSSLFNFTGGLGVYLKGGITWWCV